jgi:hypothetical protein
MIREGENESTNGLTVEPEGSALLTTLQLNKLDHILIAIISIHKCPVASSSGHYPSSRFLNSTHASARAAPLTSSQSCYSVEACGCCPAMAV